MSQLTRWGFDRASAARHRPWPLVRPAAWLGGFPIRAHRTMAEVMADEGAHRNMAKVMADEAVARETTIEFPSRAKAGDDAAGGHTSEPADESVSRPAAGRSASATSEIMDVESKTGAQAATAGETAPLPTVARIDLACARSEMDRRAAVAHEAQLAQRRAARAAEPEGRVPCRCGSPVGGKGPGMVPVWFGRDCIERDCPLKQSTAKGAARG